MVEVPLELAREYTVESMPDFEGKLELVDGRLEVSPVARWGHSRVANRVREVLTNSLGDEWLVVVEAGVRRDSANYRQPDVSVVRADVQPATEWLAPTDVALVVEVVSPSSLTVDRVVKPHQYARWGISAYWRIETDPQLALTAYILERGADVYTEVGTWASGDAVTVDQPFAVSFPLDHLLR